MSNKIVSPFAGPLTANGLKVWLGSCEDGFENYEDTHDKKLTPKTRIRLTGAALTEPHMAEWWVSGKTEFLALASWEQFVKRVKDRFMPVNWKMDALEQFYSCSQGKRDFRSFAADLTQCLGTLPPSTISVAVYKYHLLFLAHPLLYLRMRALQSFDIEDKSQTPDELIALMGSQWDSLIADTTARSGRSSALTSLPPFTGIPLVSTSSAVPVTSSPSPRYTPITEEEKAALTAVRGCWNCRGKPTDPGWFPHQRHTCPGNSALGIRPGRDYQAPTTANTAVTPAVTSTIAAAVLEESPDSPHGYPSLTAAGVLRRTSIPMDDDTSEEEDY
jgi:hypothetical protein